MKKSILFSLLLGVCISQTFAQDKLKTVQINSVLAVPNVKIDGNLTEWQGNFQAYNKAVKLYYTLANDDKYLYLIAKSGDATNSAKIAAGGITLNINTADKKSDKDAFSITYPVVNRAGRGGGSRRGGFGGIGGNRNNTNLSDSAIKAMTEEAHKQFIAAAKEIKVLGFKEITDTLISIYNEYSIKALVGYDEQGMMTCEMAVPLKALGLSTADPKEFAYQIMLSGIPAPAGGFGGRGGGGGRGGRGGGNRGGGGRGTNIDYQDLIAPTDFWAKYTLAKK